MIRNVGVAVAVLLLGMALGAGGWLLGGKAASAQIGAPVVSAVATDWTTQFEADPFERGQVRRSTVNVTRLVLVYADGRTEPRSLNK